MSLLILPAARSHVQSDCPQLEPKCPTSIDTRQALRLGVALLQWCSVGGEHWVDFQDIGFAGVLDRLEL